MLTLNVQGTISFVTNPYRLCANKGVTQILKHADGEKAPRKSKVKTLLFYLLLLLLLSLETVSPQKVLYLPKRRSFY